MAKIAVIGSGFASLSSACYLAAEGHDVHIFEKNATPGGRARQYSSMGFTFDMGPSWYWMPEVFENFFNDFGHQTQDFYRLDLLNPSFEIVFGIHDKASIPSEYEALRNWFESIELGSAEQLDRFMKEAAYKYETGIKKLVHKPGLSLLEFADWELIKGLFRLQVFSSFQSHVKKYFKHPKLISLMEFPILFLGAMPKDTPALYSLMNYAGLKLGTWYPQGGFGKVVQAFLKIALELKVSIHLNSPVEKINVTNNKVNSIVVHGKTRYFEGVIAGSDYHHTENSLLKSEYRNYTESYWKKKVFAPSSLIYYVGVKKKIPELSHHTLFFDQDLNAHAEEIYKNPKWPSQPLFYVCTPSATDNKVAPEGMENLFFLMPIAPGLEDTEDLREEYFNKMLVRLEQTLGYKIESDIVYKQSYCVNNFILDYHAYKGNAYGLANTLFQTAHLKPKINNKKIKNLFYTGQLTVPGPGVPPSIISGKVAAKLLNTYLKK